VQRVWASGAYERIEYVPPDRSVVRILRGRIDEPEALLAQLDAAGFFTWPDASLVPPADVDVDSDPFRIQFTWNARSRVLNTRAPHVPAALQDMIEALEKAAANATLSENSTVCIGQWRRRPPEGLEQKVLSPESPWEHYLQSALPGPFAIAIPLEDAEELGLTEDMTFVVRATEGYHRVKCVNWTRNEQN
jgi:hypothetical protein